MSKTISTVICETNQIKGAPQENVFFHTLYRTQQDFPDEFLRTARSTSPIQICAVFSTIGPDDVAAMLNIELNNELAKIVAAASNQHVLDFESFSNQVVNVLNIKVCNYAVARGGLPLKSSMTMLIIEGDTLRIIHIGNTKAVLIRDNKIMALTEEQTVAHRYAQMGAITPEQEKTHPENMNLTQYLGKMPQDGAIQPDKRVHLKLKENDEICLMGLGISRQMPSQMRNVILIKPTQTETKTRELINSAFNYGINTGLTAIVVKVESTFLAPGEAIFGTPLQSEEMKPAPRRPEPQPAQNEYTAFGQEDDDEDEEEYDDTTTFNRGRFGGDEDEYEDEPRAKKERRSKKAEMKAKEQKKKSRMWDILIPIITLAVCIGVGYGGMFLLFNARHLLDFMKETEASEEPMNIVMYVINDNTPLYSDESLESAQIGILNRGDAITLLENNGTFSKVVTMDNITGYVLSMQISNEDPTIEESLPEVTAEPTPVPTEETTQETEATETEEPIHTTGDTEATQSTTAATEATTTTSEETTTESTTDTTPSESSSDTTPSESSADTTPSESSSDTAPADTSSTDLAPEDTAPAAE